MNDKNIKNLLTLNVVDDKLCESEKEHAARREAQRFYRLATGHNLPLECFDCEKDESGDYIVTLNEQRVAMTGGGT